MTSPHAHSRLLDSSSLNENKPTWLPPGKRFIMPEGRSDVVGADRDQRAIQGSKAFWLIIILILLLLGLILWAEFRSRHLNQIADTNGTAVHNTSTIVVSVELFWGDCPFAPDCLDVSSIRTVSNHFVMPYEPHPTAGSMYGYCTNIRIYPSEDFEDGYWAKCDWTFEFNGDYEIPKGTLELRGMYLINLNNADDIPYPLTMFSVVGGSGNYSQVLGGSATFLPRVSDTITLTIHLDWVKTDAN